MDITFSGIDIVSMATITAIILIGIPGNILVIYVFGYRRHTKRTRFEFLLLILAIIDLVSLLIVPTSFFYLTVTKFQVWHFGHTACKVIPSLLQVSITISQGMLVLICYERYCAILFPFKHKQLSNVGISMWLLTCIGLSIVFVYPYAYTLDIAKNEIFDVNTCLPRSDRIEYLLASSCIQIIRDLTCVSIMIILSCRMNHALSREIDKTTWDRSGMSAKGRKIIKIVVIIFTILCLPVDIYQLTYYMLVTTNTAFSHDTYQIIVTTNTLLNLLQISNSVVNVFIYSKMHVFFRRVVFGNLYEESPPMIRRQPSNTITSSENFNEHDKDDLMLYRI